MATIKGWWHQGLVTDPAGHKPLWIHRFDMLFYVVLFLKLNLFFSVPHNAFTENAVNDILVVTGAGLEKPYPSQFFDHFGSQNGNTPKPAGDHQLINQLGSKHQLFDTLNHAGYCKGIQRH